MALLGRVEHNGVKVYAAFIGGKAYALSDLLNLPENEVSRNIYSIMMEDRNFDPSGKKPLDHFRYLVPLDDIKSIRDFYAFEDHVKAGRKRRNLDMIPEWYEFPVFYYSSNACLYAHEEDIPYPRYTRELDFELELAFVIGKDGSDVGRDEALDYVAGITIANDWSARDEQLREMKLNLGPAKGKDFATSLGPAILTRSDLLSLRDDKGRFSIGVEGYVNGVKLSSSNLDRMYFSIESMIERASMCSRIRKGDIFMTGTFDTGCIVELGPEKYGWLKRNDVVEFRADGIGSLRNRVV